MMEPSKPPVAFLGLGKMGAAMASNLQRAGFPLTVWNRSPGKAETFVAAGARLAETPAEAGAAADIVISSLYDDVSVLEVLTGADGLLAGMREGSVHVGTSTISPAGADKLARLHAETNTSYLAGPVLGRLPAAEAGKLVTFIGGDIETFESVRPVVTAYAPLAIHAGPRARDASLAKLIANFLGVASIDLIGQVLAFAEKSGLRRELAVQLLMGFFATDASHDYVRKIGERNFDETGFTASGGLKDVTLMIDAAKEAGVELSTAQSIRKKLGKAIELGWEDKDWSCFTDIDRT